MNSNCDYDVCIVGAGPAGAYLASELSPKYKVLLLEKNKDVYVNNFSSGGAPIDILKEFNIPESVVGAYWNSFFLCTNSFQKIWKSKNHKGVVMEYSHLKKYFIDKATASGADVKFSAKYISHINDENKINVVEVAVGENSTKEKFTCRVIVDASGSRSSVLKNSVQEKFTAKGVEYRIRTKLSDEHKTRLDFLLGTKWMPNGYGWVFPMGNDEYKVGTCVCDVKYDHDLVKYLENIIKNHLKISDYELIDKHGGTIVIPKKEGFMYYDKSVIGVGDSVYAINPLGAEGIRHGMRYAKIAFSHIANFLDGNISDFKPYEQEIKKYKGIKWRLSFYFASKVYERSSDALLDFGLRVARIYPFKDALNVFFEYKYIRFFLKYPFYYLYSRVSKIS